MSSAFSRPIPPVTSPEAMCDAIRAAGIIPFFKGPVPGFSIEELTPPEHWFASSDELGPWDWKIAAVQSGDIAYGKFLCGGKAAFATVECYAHLHNWRLSLPEFAPDSSGSRVLELAAEQGSVSSADIRRLLGIKKAAADGVSSRLMHQTRLLIGDIERVYRGPSLKYSGWQHCSFCTPEALFSADASSPAPGALPAPGTLPAAASEATASDPVRGSAAHPSQPGGWAPPSNDAEGGTPLGGSASAAAPVLFGGFSPFTADDPLAVGCSPEESLAELLRHLRDLLPGVPEPTLLRLLR